jgi:transposase
VSKRNIYVGKPLFGEGGLFTQFLKELIQIVLPGEMNHDLQDSSLEHRNNRYNGINSKTVKKAGEPLS